MNPDSFNSILDDRSSKELATLWGQRPQVLDLLDLQQLRDIASSAIAILVSGGFRDPFVRMTKDGQALDPEHFTSENRVGGVAYKAADFLQVERLMRDQGTTLVLLGLETVVSAADEVAKSLTKATRQPTDINLYLTPSSERGFARHFDPQEVLLLQIAGSKVWELWKPECKPQVGEYFAVPAEAGAADLTVTLEKGQALHIPRGWIHRGQSDRCLSGHLTVGVTPGVPISGNEKAESIGLSELEDHLRDS